MKLFIHELQTVLKQKIRVRSQNLQLVYVRLHLARYLNPTGTLTLELQNNLGELIVASDPLDIGDIPATEDYFHGWIRFALSHQLKAGAEYFLALRAGGGYTFNTNTFIGWCNDFDLRHVPSSYANDGSVSAPLGIEVWAKEYVTRKGL